MSLLDYSKHFSDHETGPFHSIKLLKKPVKPLRDVNLTESGQQSLIDMMSSVERGQNKVLALYDKSIAERALLINAIAYQLAQPVCFVSSKALIKHYIGETEKNLSSLFARAETKHWILFFDEADALFGPYTSEEKANKKVLEQRFEYLIKRMSLYPSLAVLSLSTKTVKEKVGFATQHLI